MCINMAERMQRLAYAQLNQTIPKWKSFILRLLRTVQAGCQADEDP